MSEKAAKRATRRPEHLKPPVHLSASPPVPKPEPFEMGGEPGRVKPDPVRYGDWENNGIAIDF